MYRGRSCSMRAASVQRGRVCPMKIDLCVSKRQKSCTQSYQKTHPNSQLHRRRYGLLVLKTWLLKCRYRLCAAGHSLACFLYLASTRPNSKHFRNENDYLVTQNSRGIVWKERQPEIASAILNHLHGGHDAWRELNS